MRRTDSPADRTAIIALSPRRVARGLVGAAILVVLFAAMMVVARHGFGYRGTTGIGRLFTLDAESNVPAWFSSALLLCAAVLLWVNGRQHASARRGGAPWFGLAAVFAGLSLDETAQMHESLTERLRPVMPTEGPLYYGWVIPAALFVGVVGIAYSRFLLRLPSRTARLFVVAGAVYVGGALGVEMIAAWLDWSGAMRIGSLGYTLVTMVEESMEMTGVIVFIYALLDHLAAVESPGPTA